MDAHEPLRQRRRHHPDAGRRRASRSWSSCPLVAVGLRSTPSGTRRPATPARRNTTGACWAFVKANFGQFIYGRYPDPERWRVNIFFVLLAAGIIPMAIPSAPFKGFNLLYIFIIFPVVSGFLLVGGVLRPAGGRDGGLGRAVPDARRLLCRHGDVVAARHPAGARPPLEDAGGAAMSACSSSRSAAACR